jgi:hypothetical protein
MILILSRSPRRQGREVMTNPQYVALLQRDITAWNTWREKSEGAQLDTDEPDLIGLSLPQADLRRADLHGARLRGANLRGANLEGADLRESDLREADLRGACLRQAVLEGANLHHTNLSQALLQDANLRTSHLIGTNFEGANLQRCSVYGASVWDVNLKGAQQAGVLITHPEEAKIMVDDLRVAQLTHLLLNEQEIGAVIDALTATSVLILGGFSGEREKVWSALQQELRSLHYLPIPFDFATPQSRNITETISTLTHLARFVIADLTEARDLRKLRAVVPEAAVPIQTLLQVSEVPSTEQYKILADIARYPWVLPLVEYATPDQLITHLKERVIEPAEEKVKELEKVRTRV